MSFSKLFLLSLFLISFNLCLKLKTKSKCVSLGSDCDFTAYCCGDYVCKDYRCAVQGTKDNQVEWAPKGDKCDVFHHCRKYYHCESNYCVITKNKVISDVEKTLKYDY